MFTHEPDAFKAALRPAAREADGLSTQLDFLRATYARSVGAMTTAERATPEGVELVTHLRDLACAAIAARDLIVALSVAENR